MVREVDPEGFLPEFVREFREIKEILRAEKPELQAAADAADRARDCAFIMYCGENDIGRFERMMGAFPAAGDSLEERQARVLIRWNEAPPYTAASLGEKLAAICGEDNFSVNIRYDEYRLEIIVTLTRAGQVDELERLLQRIIPANMTISVRNNMTIGPSAVIFAGGTVSACAFSVIGS